MQLPSPKPLRDNRREQEQSDEYDDVLPMAVTFQISRLAFAKLGRLAWHFTPSIVRWGLQPLPRQPWGDSRDGRRRLHLCYRKFACIIAEWVLNFPAPLGKLELNARNRVDG
jgi:hypothetical protein